MSSLNDLKCSICGVSFSAKKNLYRHMRKLHPNEDLKLGNLKCPICSNNFVHLTDLHRHLESEHEDVTLNHDKKKFYSEEEFINWKKEVEEETCSLFILKCGVKRQQDGSEVKYYTCHRNGQFENKESRSRHLKCGGSNKIDLTCPASMKMTITFYKEVKEIEVEYQSSHVGHKLEVGRIPLNKEKKIVLASKLNMGIPPSKILSDIRKDFSPTKRLSITTGKDLSNLKRDFKIDNSTTYDQNDAASVDIIVNKLQCETGNPVLVYKRLGENLEEHPLIQKEDFLLGLMNNAQQKILEIYGKNGVMIDSTHGTNKYGFQLTTLMVNDDNHEGLPVAILYSTRSNAETFVSFFSAIRDRVTNLAPKYFMSDDAPAFYNAWKSVFGDNSKHLICSWHINRAWNKNLLSKIKNEELRTVVKNDLQELLRETEEVTFINQIEKFKHQYFKIEETKSFAEYFVKNYANRTEDWAYCFRKGAGINTNMKLERWHRQIKHEEAGGTIIKRLDKSLFLVLNAISKKLIGRIVSMERNKLTTKISEIRKRHLRSQDMDSKLIIETIKEKEWIFTKYTDDNLVFTYKIERGEKCSCNIKCDTCNICIHEYSCSCIDYSIRFVICKHIHLVCRNFTASTAEISLSDETEGNLQIDLTDREERYAIVKEMQKEKVNSNLTDLDLTGKFQSILNRANTQEKKALIDEVLSTLDIRMFTLETNNSTLLMPEVSNAEIKEPANKNIKLQRH